MGGEGIYGACSGRDAASPAPSQRVQEGGSFGLWEGGSAETADRSSWAWPDTALRFALCNNAEQPTTLNMPKTRVRRLHGPAVGNQTRPRCITSI